MLSYLAIKWRRCHAAPGVAVAVNDFTGINLASQGVGKHESVESQQQLVIIDELIPEDEANWDELSVRPESS